MKQHILFAGIRASGKSTLGKLVAEKINRPFFDLDYEVLKTTECKTLYEMVKTYDLRDLAKREHELLKNFLEREELIVLSTGGRTFSHADMDVKGMNKEVAMKNSFIIVPVTDPDKLWGRIVEDQHKEHSNSTLERLKSNHEDALGFLGSYKEMADLIISTDGDTPEETVDKIIAEL